MKRGLLCLLLVFALIPAFSQDECEISLQRASEEFQAGHFSIIPSLLKDCISGNRSPEWRQRAFLLLAQTYLIMDDQFGADQSYLQVLRANPEYTTDLTRDPSELVYLSKKFTAEPIFSLFARLGGNISPVSVIHDVSISGDPATGEKYKVRPGMTLGGGVEYHYNSRLSAQAEVNFQFTAFQHGTVDLFGTGKDEVTLTSRQTSITIPLVFKYSHSFIGKFKPFGYAGFGFNLLLSDNAGIVLVNRDSPPENSESDPIIQERESPTINLMANRNKNSLCYVVGGGVKYKYKLNYFFADIRWMGSLQNHVDPAKRYYGGITQFPYVDDDFRLNNLSINLGFVYPLYKPRPVRKVRSASVLKAINKADD